MIYYMISIYLFFMSLIFWFMFMIFNLMNYMFFIEWNLLNFNSLKILFIIYIDWMNLIFINTILLISFIVILYSLEYMKNDKFLKRFMMLIFIFIISMILMIFSPNMFSILLGWDGLGLSSYCLIAYYQSKKSFNSSNVTILMNRFGDIMILLSICFMMSYGSWNFIFLKKIKMIMSLLIFLASITKSAQIPFSTWLPMAMAAPTPVSSLVHSSTLVTAGVYLLIRFNFLLNENLKFLFMMISFMTMFMSGLMANFEFDIKKIIALSTLSQLGLMILMICLNFTKLAYFHLITHAMFKSLLFLCSGIIIHNYLNNQDIRFLSFVNNFLPTINLIFNMSLLTLCGLPFLSGFFSKDLMIEMFLMNKFNMIMFILIFLSMGFTMSYTFRLIFYLTLKNKKILNLYFYNSKNLMNYSIFLLYFLSVFYGFILNWLMFSSMNFIFLPKFLKLFIYIILIMSLFLGLLLPKYILINFFLNKKINLIYLFLNKMWFMYFLLKKNKMNLLLFNNKILYFNELTWMELITIKKIYFYLNLLNKKENIYIIFFFFMYMINWFIYILLLF
uniref:NADH-ubiquinone oxidoreductase chain 5 n=1 Tax=Virgulibracon endoxylaphagus TaxID=2933211 RepID=A0A8T9JCW5_9HYME|nr:NADH dehydrogenase subunit 5 [Virgulibracon endoxylaphagus]UOK09631.1 NADH dehydrogenase subunit 5 [Virgulibracon endoxylaphagus]